MNENPEIYHPVTDFIKLDEPINYQSIEAGLHGKIPIKDVLVEIKEKPDDPYTLCVDVSLPLFVPSIDETTGELWYHCTKADLAYTIRDDGYYFSTDDEDIYNFLSEFKEEIINAIEENREKEEVSL
ncbi:MAG: hypothetical protein IJH63_10160 [Methanobrevibacter sp.]|nr:hypothetical protein [Methanosphaera sp.]MBR0371062.1 hypothetical protein [Methanobrevibacter sp.]